MIPFSLTSLALLALIAFQLLLRIYVIASHWTGIDTFYHLAASREIRKARGLPKAIEQFAYHGPYAYPPLFHIILALVPIRFSRFLSFCWDILQAYLVFSLVFWLTAHNLLLSLLSSAIFLSIPENFLDSLSANPRPLATLLFSASVSCILLWPNFMFEVLFVTLYGLLLMSHKMTAQVSWFVLAPLSIILGTLSGLLAAGVVLSFAFAILVSGGFYVKVLREHLAYLQFHFRYGGLTTGKKAFPRPIVFFKSNPFLLPLLLIIPQAILVRNPLLLLVLVLATVALATVWRFGDAHRFLTSSSWATAVVVATFVSSEWFAALCLVLLAYCVWRQVGIVRRLASPFLISDNLLRSFHYLKGEMKDRLLCLPLSYSYAGAYFTGKTVVAGDASIGGLVAEVELSKNLHDIQKIPSVLKENQVGLVIVDSKALPEYPSTLERSGYASFAASGEFVLLRRTESA